MRWGARPSDPDLRERQARLLRDLSARESPRVLFLFAAVIVVFDVGYALVGIIPPPAYYLSDAVQGAYLIAVGIVILRRMVPVRWAPALFASAIVVNNLALNFQYTLVGYSAVGVILLLMASYGAVTLMWRPFLVSAAIMAAVTTYTLVTVDPEQGPGWAVTAYTALLISAVLLYGRSTAVVDLASANRTIEQMATRDALTGLLNRHGLREASPLLSALVERSHVPMFAVFVDVNGLKAVNDTHGHQIGDLVIVRTARALEAQLRESDLLCRWGGDEFVILGAGEAPDSRALAARISSSIDVSGFEGSGRPRSTPDPRPDRATTSTPSSTAPTPPCTSSGAPVTPACSGFPSDVPLRAASTRQTGVTVYQGGSMFGVGGFSGGSAGGPHYEIEVNEGSVNMKKFTSVANERHGNGYRMAHVFSQEGNTIVVWERVS